MSAAYAPRRHRLRCDTPLIAPKTISNAFEVALFHAGMWAIDCSTIRDAQSRIRPQQCTQVFVTKL
jgi:hypothetical protein